MKKDGIYVNGKKVRNLTKKEKEIPKLIEDGIKNLFKDKEKIKNKTRKYFLDGKEVTEDYINNHNLEVIDCSTIEDRTNNEYHYTKSKDFEEETEEDDKLYIIELKFYNKYWQNYFGDKRFDIVRALDLYKKLCKQFNTSEWRIVEVVKENNNEDICM